MKKILIAGGSGYVGRNLTSLLKTKGYDVAWLTRRPDVGGEVKQYFWDYKQRKIDLSAFADSSAVVNLAGSSINGKRWNKKYKEEIYNSRIRSTEFLFETLTAHPNSVSAFIQASATGYYGTAQTDKILSETDSAGDDFLGCTCADWEKAASRFSEKQVRTVILRTGIVFCRGSEAFEKMSLPVRYGFGAVLGTGNQYFSWIHVHDLCRIYLKALEDEKMRGDFNAVAPQFITNSEVTETLARHFKRKLWLPKIPDSVVKILFGKVADLLLNGNRISSKKIMDSDFDFIYKTVQSILHDSNKNY